MMNQTNIASKNLLAKLLATENIRVEHNPKAYTASFDLKNRVLNLPVWEAMDGDMYDMLLGHEVSHAKNTPAAGWHTAITGINKKQNSYKHFLNIVEDARIEKLIKRQYPGIRRPFLKAYQDLFNRDLFQVKGKNLSSLYFIDRVNMHCKLGFALMIKFNAQERALLNLVETAESWDDVINATNKIWDYSKNEQKEDQDKTKQKMQDMSESLSGMDDEDEDEDEFGDEEYEESDDFEDSDEGEAADDSEDSDEGDQGSKSDEESDDAGDEEDENEGGAARKSDKQTEEKSDEQKEVKNGQLSRYKDSVDPSAPSTQDFVPQAATDEAFRANEHLLTAKNAPMTRYIELPTPNLGTIITKAKTTNHELTALFGVLPDDQIKQRKLLEQFQSKNKAYIASMAKEFEMKKAAKLFSKVKVSESGDINISKLGLFRTEDDIFKKLTTLHKGKNHGLVLLLDKSGSMRGSMNGAIEQILVLASFCRKVNIPFVAYGYTNNQYRGEISLGAKKPCFSVGPKQLHLASVGLREIINSNMKVKEFAQAMMNHLALGAAYDEYLSNKLDHLPHGEILNNTPLNEALVAMLPVVKSFKQDRKLDLVNVVIVHDGDSDYTNRYYDERNSSTCFDTESERVYFRDPVSGTEILAPKEQGYRAITVALMEMLKKTCDVGIYGFFIGSGRVDLQTYYVDKNGNTLTPKSYAERALKLLESKQLLQTLNHEKFLESFTPGYNRFYFMPNGSQLKVVDEPIVIKGSVTARKLSMAFIKQGKAKYSNRVLVSRFIEGIAK